MNNDKYFIVFVSGMGYLYSGYLPVISIFRATHLFFPSLI